MLLLIHFNNVVHILRCMKIWPGTRKVTSIDLLSHNAIFVQMLERFFFQSFGFLGISLGIHGNQKQISQFVSYLTHVSKSGGKLVILVICAEWSM